MEAGETGRVGGMLAGGWNRMSCTQGLRQVAHPRSLQSRASQGSEGGQGKEGGTSTRGLHTQTATGCRLGDAAARGTGPPPMPHTCVGDHIKAVILIRQRGGLVQVCHCPFCEHRVALELRLVHAQPCSMTQVGRAVGHHRCGFSSVQPPCPASGHSSHFDGSQQQQEGKQPQQGSKNRADLPRAWLGGLWGNERSTRSRGPAVPHPERGGTLHCKTCNAGPSQGAQQWAQGAAQQQRCRCRRQQQDNGPGEVSTKRMGYLCYRHLPSQHPGPDTQHRSELDLTSSAS